MKEDLLFCRFDLDNGCMELCFADGRTVAIDCTATENDVADNLYRRLELAYLIYNDLLEYAKLILNSDLEYLKTVTAHNSEQ